MKKSLLIITLGVASLLSASSFADNIKAGEKLSETCVACHGVNGAQPISNYPILAGQHKDYLYKTMVDYQDGSRYSPVMAPLVSEFTDEDLRNIAAYFASKNSSLE